MANNSREYPQGIRPEVIELAKSLDGKKLVWTKLVEATLQDDLNEAEQRIVHGVGKIVGTTGR